MPFVLYVAPFFNDNAIQLIGTFANLPDIRLGIISQEPQEKLDEGLRAKLYAHWRVENALDAEQLAWAVEELTQRHGPAHRLIGAMEHIQTQLAEVRQRFGIAGMDVTTAQNFRDKAQMKRVLQEAGLPCARFCQVDNAAAAWGFADEVGYPMIIKPLDGAGSQATYQVHNGEDLQKALGQVNLPAIMEEFVTGREFSFETVSVNGQAVWHSWTHYSPTPLEAMQNAWIQWCVVLPREVDDPTYAQIRQAAPQALTALGMETGLTHMEWFLRPDNSIAISEVAARPPGANIMPLISRAHDVDFDRAWAELMVWGKFEPPVRKYAAGAAFLRGQGKGVVKAVRGLVEADEEVGEWVTDVKLPRPGQPASISYEGEGYIIVRHPQTAVVEKALQRIINLVRVELG